jgi:hypothetical protein
VGALFFHAASRTNGLLEGTAGRVPRSLLAISRDCVKPGPITGSPAPAEGQAMTVEQAVECALGHAAGGETKGSEAAQAFIPSPADTEADAKKRWVTLSRSRPERATGGHGLGLFLWQ